MSKLQSVKQQVEGTLAAVKAAAAKLAEIELLMKATLAFINDVANPPTTDSSSDVRVVEEPKEKHLIGGISDSQPEVAPPAVALKPAPAKTKDMQTLTGKVIAIDLKSNKLTFAVDGCESGEYDIPQRSECRGLKPNERVVLKVSGSLAISCWDVPTE